MFFLPNKKINRQKPEVAAKSQQKQISKNIKVNPKFYTDMR